MLCLNDFSYLRYKVLSEKMHNNSRKNLNWSSERNIRSSFYMRHCLLKPNLSCGPYHCCGPWRLTVPVVSCCWALSQPVQTSVQKVLDPVLCARRVLHPYCSVSVKGQETELVLAIRIWYIPIHVFCGILSPKWFSCVQNVHIHACTQTCPSLFMNNMCYHVCFA